MVSRGPSLGTQFSVRELSQSKGIVMITLEDCIALCGLSEQEVQAIAEHEHIPEIAAAAMGRYRMARRKFAT
jgi:hypothetical protein